MNNDYMIIKKLDLELIDNILKIIFYGLMICLFVPYFIVIMLVIEVIAV